MEFKTDSCGNTIEAIRVYDEKAPNKNPNIDSKKVLNLTKGLKENEDAGHLLQRNLGGINECINLLPMPSDWQRNGIWRKLELLEEGIVEIEKQNGSKIVSTRRLSYDDKSMLPNNIEFDVQVNGLTCINYTVLYPV